METVFESAHIRFVRLTEELMEDYLAMVNDIERVAWFIGRRTEPFTLEEEQAFVRGKLAEEEAIFSMLEKESGAFIGNIELMDIADGAGVLGIAITAGMQNRGYGREAIPALIAYGLENLGLERITLNVYPENARAIHVYEKCGFREVSRTESDVCMAYDP